MNVATLDARAAAGALHRAGFGAVPALAARPLR